MIVVATMHAREGKEDRVRDILVALVVESRQEEGCLQYDLLIGHEDPREFALYEVWESEAALNAHLRSKHVSVAYTFSAELCDEEPKVIAYRAVEPARKAHTGPTRRLDDGDE